MRVLVINSPLFSEPISNHSGQSLPPLGLGFIISSLRKSGFLVDFIDAFSQNLSIGKLVEIIKDYETDVLLMNVFSANLSIIYSVIEQIDESIKIILGGGTKQVYTEILEWKFKQSTYVIIGEGELVIPSILKNEYDGIYIQKNNVLVASIDPFSKFFPHDISGLEVDHSVFLNEPFLHHQGFWECYISISRGCIYNCAFCGSARSINSHIPIRTRSVESVQKELDSLLRNNSCIQTIRVLDDLFLKDELSTLHAIEIFKKYPLTWRSTAHILSLSTLSDEKLKCLKESGCRELFVGIESGSPRILTMIHKVSDVSLIKTTIQRVLNAGINVKGYFIAGFPTETFQDLEMTLSLAKELKSISMLTSGEFRTSVFRFRPYHGTELFKSIYQNVTYVNPNEQDKILSERIGRSQFNVSSGNYSDIEENSLEYFIYQINLIQL